MRRRAWLTTAGVAAAAAAAGAGLSWWRLRPDDAAGEVAVLWEQTLQTPHGPPLPLAQLRGRPLLVNFWATWCPPCVKEMPQLERFHRAHRERGWQVLGIAVDRADAVRTFLTKTPVSFPIALAGFEGADLSRRLGNASGALPFSVLLDREGRVLQRKLGETSFEELSDWAARLR